MKTKIYRITFPDDTFYIGQTSNSNRRFKNHLSEAKNGYHKSKTIQHKFDEYGQMKFEVLLELEGDKSYINLVERIMIEDHPNVLNSNSVQERIFTTRSNKFNGRPKK